MKRLLALAAALVLTVCAAPPPAAAQSSDEQTEIQIGQQEYQQLAQQGVLLQSSPYYAILNPIAKQIKTVADQKYFRPFTFILVHDKAPNAFSVPGGNVYVTDTLMQFVENREELAGVLCHETAHDIHHDVLNLYKKQQRTATGYTIGAILANVLTGGKAQNAIGEVANIGFTLQSQGFSRDVERRADLTGSDLCASVGSNPYGMVWLFERFSKEQTGGTMEALSDHPSDQHRIADLETHFRSNPALFNKFNPNIASATPLSAGQRAQAKTTYRTSR